MAENRGGEAMRRARVDRDLTQRELAEKLGISGSEVSDYENGRKAPALARAVMIEKELGISVEVWL